MKSTSKVVFCGVAILVVVLGFSWSLGLSKGLGLAGVAILVPCEIIYYSIKKSPKYGTKDFLPMIVKQLLKIFAFFSSLSVFMVAMSLLAHGIDDQFTKDVIAMAIGGVITMVITIIVNLLVGYRQWTMGSEFEETVT